MSIKARVGSLQRLAAGAALLALAGFAAPGCDSESFMPPVNPELRSNESKPAPARPIALVLGRHEPEDTELWKSAARTQAGLDKATLHISSMSMGDPTTKQVDLIRDILTRNPRVLIVEPVDPADLHLAQAIEKARGQGIPVVVVGRPLVGEKPTPAASDASAGKSSASADHHAPLILLEPRFAASAKQLVEATIRVTQYSELEPAAGAVVAVNTVADPFVAQRAVAIKDALKAAGIATVEEVQFATDAKAGEKQLKETLKAHPKIAMLFGVDSTSSHVIRDVIGAVADGQLLIAGCYTTEDQFANISRIANFAAVADFSPPRVIRKSITTAVALAQGKDVPPAVEFRINVSESPVKSNILRTQIPATKKSFDQAKEKMVRPR